MNTAISTYETTTNNQVETVVENKKLLKNFTNKIEKLLTRRNIKLLNKTNYDADYYIMDGIKLDENNKSVDLTFHSITKLRDILNTDYTVELKRVDFEEFLLGELSKTEIAMSVENGENVGSLIFNSKVGSLSFIHTELLHKVNPDVRETVIKYLMDNKMYYKNI